MSMAGPDQEHTPEAMAYFIKRDEIRSSRATFSQQVRAFYQSHGYRVETIYLSKLHIKVYK